MVNIPDHVKTICVHTGNILNLNEVKKNAGQNSSEEVRSLLIHAVLICRQWNLNILIVCDGIKTYYSGEVRSDKAPLPLNLGPTA